MAKILVADDEKDVRTLIKFTLERRGYTVIEAADGLKALAAISESQPDLILLDVMMPGLDGYKVCRQLKNDPTTQHIPVVFLSAKGQTYEVDEGLKSGALAYIVKPFSPRELASRVNEILANQNG